MNKVTPNINQDIKVTVDAIVFGYNQENGISVLLIKRKIEPFLNEWALPGGFVLNHETLEEAVERELLEEAGVSINYLEQLFTFGKPSRDPRMRIISVWLISGWSNLLTLACLLPQMRLKQHGLTSMIFHYWLLTIRRSLKKLLPA
ncbi:NUDIX domain-containing protein [Pedobacter sp. NJ-S-72]